MSEQTRQDSPPTYDVIIVGAGLSGIGTAYWLQRKCPAKRYAILESREQLGGTWDLFRYPGVRSDSDMFTFGYRFRPWRQPQPLAAGAEILDYLRETAAAYGIDKRIRYGHRVIGADWDSTTAYWTLTVEKGDHSCQFRTRFLYMCSGYYSYTEAHRPTFAGEADFKGAIVHPQFWSDDTSYTDRRVVVVGSGATAVTLVPTLAERAAHVTMLQRSPTYIMTIPNRNAPYDRMRRVLPERWAYRINRWINLGGSMALYGISQLFPNRIKRWIMNNAAKQLGPEVDVDVHFNPRYDPWDQRLCLVPDGDLFRSIRGGRAAVVTDRIDRFTSGGIRLESGRELPADLVVLATGLKIRLLGGARVTVDGREIRTGDIMIYKGMLAAGVPNFAIAFGYTNASWTLKTDLTANYVCRLLRHMDRKGYRVVTPTREAGVDPRPLLDFSAGYIRRAGDKMPVQGSRRPWRVYQNYLADALLTRYERIDDGVLEFR
ncbi:NAD(P)/FAD-dependent oxidoreductase [Lewinella sp. JB7]|uniref:flavin-containing monooxygenase n=1 Tax=Lewinella sp. JB7 TaxID=2962887 RepID=UPI0020C9D4FA|nr:NAD(P)/FAD-dependent oxidoreductase [Lewinella sp. JB7]MCP9234631.1 NAD(P)/FAD-dependent oxidoreductase [Lewinella sp. JB7]